MGHIADIFTKPVLATLPGRLAIGHTRYSTAGDTVMLNAQPFSVQTAKGRVAVAHNGNITNAAELRRDLGRDGAIFQASSDTEVILHLMAHSKERTLCRRAARCAAPARGRLLSGVSWRRTASSSRATRTASGRWRSAKWKSPAAASAMSSPPKPARST